MLKGEITPQGAKNESLHKIDGGYENIDIRLNKIGARIKRFD